MKQIWLQYHINQLCIKFFSMKRIYGHPRMFNPALSPNRLVFHAKKSCMC